MVRIKKGLGKQVKIWYQKININGKWLFWNKEKRELLPSMKESKN